MGPLSRPASFRTALVTLIFTVKMPDKTGFRKAGSLWLHRGGGHEAAGGILSMVRKPQEVDAGG